MPAAIASVAEFVRRVVDGLLRGECRGRFLCARCLVTLTRDHLDRSYTAREIARAMEDVFRAPGRITPPCPRAWPARAAPGRASG